jgi:hypothetical protein
VEATSIAERRSWSRIIVQEWLLLLLHVGKVPARKDMFRKINRVSYDTKRDGTVHQSESENHPPQKALNDVYMRMCDTHNNTGFDRCVEMKLPDAEGVDKEGLDEFTRKLRVCVGNSLGKQIHFYQAEVDKLYESRAIPGWNYCSFFATKVPLPARLLLH